ncbi:MAG: DNA-3-methyladenine glycosylase I [Acidimicrobiia bacterium]|nr:DNA-3-methyladenine glycosylase I [Acidimicrobiia bacterium]
MIAYHDDEWGVPVHDDRRLFEKITLEGAQAGLSWSTILNKRDGYRAAFAAFDPAKVARFTDARVARLMADPSIVRNRMKIESTVTNAAAVLRVQREEGSLDAYMWGWVDGVPVVNRWKRLADVPAQNPLSKAISVDMKRRGFRFVGPTTIYSMMQAVGMVNDHIVNCPRHAELTTS